MPVRTLSTLLFLLLPSAALAAGGGDGHHEPQWSLTLWGFANFAIYCWIIRRFAWPLVKEYLEDRRIEVVEALEAAARAKAEAERLKSEFEMRMKSLESEAEKARAEILDLAEGEAKRRVQQAEATAQQIRKDAQLVADQEVTRARLTLQEESAVLVTQMATELVSSQLKPEDQERFVKEFLSESREEAS